MRVIFAGTPDFSVPVMQTLLDSTHEVVAVYTQPDRPAGRGRKLTASPVKQLALEHDIQVFQPRSLRDASEQAQLEALQPDLMVVVAYGLILPQEVLDTPSLGCVNLHASLLPRWRGAAPIQRAIQAGDTETGVCLMQMEAGLDSGPVLAQIATAISEQETGGSLHDRLSALAAQLLGAHLDDLQARRLQPRAQDESRVSYAHKLDKSEARLDWTRPSDELERQVRAFNPWPVASTGFEGESLRVWRARSVGDASGVPPGTVVQATRDGIEVACGQGRLSLLEVQMPGARRLPVADFLNARNVDGAVFS